jgi:hypothetical protein
MVDKDTTDGQDEHFVRDADRSNGERGEALERLEQDRLEALKSWRLGFMLGKEAKDSARPHI